MDWVIAVLAVVSACFASISMLEVETAEFASLAAAARVVWANALLRFFMSLLHAVSTFAGFLTGVVVFEPDALVSASVFLPHAPEVAAAYKPAVIIVHTPMDLLVVMKFCITLAEARSTGQVCPAAE